ncbi:MAG: Segregation and condensation protein B [Candidatus Magasanikbacteria bacterium GW2011_GWC2_40_17]|uniref:Segregation and condensation protein B n=1 Tax=Candidatus Magasanikbacteria bacterium GW2011_GWA2_42_32 TaxID=1619039 RepID=A0A0G1A737_9BACT|nr:MAG: Segregation and condensation protein B [Candidatus Magasanikbacteria bacterium GW2011_GWC2_40_17]KKS56774.1 MAG: Segregation and condensation protein B [Candidatus Magasanikbacteria bacterium GW2011_GWA2_42_32]
MPLTSKIESLLFIASKPLSFKKMAELLAVEKEEIASAVANLKEKYNQENNGIKILQEKEEIQMATDPQNSSLVKEFIKDETTGELTRPSLEALTIIAYRGPITKLELEQIRGVNCSLILRNLLLRGLIKEEDDKEKLQNVYSITFDFLRFLGVEDSAGLPDYEKLHSHNLLEKLLEEMNKSAQENTVVSDV